MPVSKRPSKSLGEIEKSVAALLRSRVLVGIPASAGSAGDGQASRALIGYVQEYGCDEKHIPARPFLQPGMADAEDDIVVQMEKAAKAAFSNDAAGVDKALNAAGIIAQSSVQRKITTGPFAPLAPATIYARAHRKRAPRDSDKPLVDTGELLKSITYVIEK